MHLPTAKTDRQVSGQLTVVKGRMVGAVGLGDGKGVAYLQYISYIDRKVNDAITFEQSDFSEIHESKTFYASCRFR